MCEQHVGEGGIHTYEQHLENVACGDVVWANGWDGMMQRFFLHSNGFACK